MALARIVLFIAVHTSIRTVDHLTELIKSCFGDSKFSRIDLKRTKCTAIIRNLWGPYFEKAVVEDVGDQPYSLIIDESTDISTQKMLGVVIKYVSIRSRKIVSTFLSLLYLPDSSAEGISTTIDQFIKKSGLNPAHCIGLGTDNAAVMVGLHNGAHQKLERLWGKK